jgi:hypothetical protein
MKLVDVKLRRLAPFAKNFSLLFLSLLRSKEEARRAEAKHTTLRVIEKEKISEEGKLM